MALEVNNPPTKAGRHKRPEFDPWVGKIPWRRTRPPTPVSCLENPMDRGAWWATTFTKANQDWILFTSVTGAESYRVVITFVRRNNSYFLNIMLL